MHDTDYYTVMINCFIDIFEWESFVMTWGIKIGVDYCTTFNRTTENCLIPDLDIITIRTGRTFRTNVTSFNGFSRHFKNLIKFIKAFIWSFNFNFDLIKLMFDWNEKLFIFMENLFIKEPRNSMVKSVQNNQEPIKIIWLTTCISK